MRQYLDAPSTEPASIIGKGACFILILSNTFESSLIRIMRTELEAKVKTKVFQRIQKSFPGAAYSDMRIHTK